MCCRFVGRVRFVEATERGLEDGYRVECLLMFGAAWGCDVQPGGGLAGCGEVAIVGTGRAASGICVRCDRAAAVVCLFAAQG